VRVARGRKGEARADQVVEETLRGILLGDRLLPAADEHSIDTSALLAAPDICSQNWPGSRR